MLRSLRPRVAATDLSRLQIQVHLTVDFCRRSRSSNLLGNLTFLGLAICVFTWGLQYKLSLYEPPQAVSHRVVQAKLLSEDEQSIATPDRLAVRAKLTDKVTNTVLAAMFLILFTVPLLLNTPASGQLADRSNPSWHPRRTPWSIRFVRPPPALVLALSHSSF